jgi:glycosyltransferase involved in cell wall biosynthesis
MLRIGIRNLAGDDWTAGGTYQLNLLESIQKASKGVDVVLLTFPGTSARIVEPYRKYVADVIEIPAPVPSTRFLGLQAKFERVVWKMGLEHPTSRNLRRNGIQAIFSPDDFGSGFRIPNCVWIQDFQALRLPEFFPNIDSKRLRKSLNHLIKQSQTVVLSSYAAKRDLQELFPAYANKARVLQFVAHVPEIIYERDPAWICKTYHLPQKFFYLPNQFWEHKNHTVVLDALVYAKQKVPEIRVVCTGNTTDYRNRLYFSNLLARISELNLRENFIILGLVPHEHVYWLMRQSVGIIQPSLFEGWSTTVEEARSLGKPLLLSEIEVHREQNPPDSHYFDPTNPATLADLLVQEFTVHEAGLNKQLEIQARESLSSRLVDFGNRFIDILSGAA